MSSGRYMAYSPSPSTAPQSPHISGIRNATNVLAEQEKYLSELLAERHKLGPFMPVLPHSYRLLNQGYESLEAHGKYLVGGLERKEDFRKDHHPPPPWF